jgi:UDP-glucose 4-epimerase
MPIALVTGATGFIGRRLCARLRGEGWRVVGVARHAADGPWEDFVVHEFGTGTGLVLPIRPTVVFHLASRTHALAERPGEAEGYYRTTVGGMRELLAALPDHGGVRVVFASSVKAHGESTSVEGVDESSPCAPTTPYGRSKLEAEELLRNSGVGLQATVLRLAMVYGPGQKGNLSEMIRAITCRRFPPIPENGNRRSIVHVDDVVDALLLAGATAKACGRTYYVSEPRTYSSRTIYEEIHRALGRRVPWWIVPVASLRVAGWAGDLIGRMRGRRFIWDSDKHAKLFGSAHYRSERLSQELSWVARHSLIDALPEMVKEAAAG